MDFLIDHYDTVKAATIGAVFGLSVLGSVLLVLRVHPTGIGTLRLAKITGLVVAVFAVCSLLAWGFLVMLEGQLPRAV